MCPERCGAVLHDFKYANSLLLPGVLALLSMQAAQEVTQVIQSVNPRIVVLELDQVCNGGQTCCTR